MDARAAELISHLDAFTGFVRKRVRDETLAADVVQDAMTKALARIDQVQDDERLVAWFYRILRHTIADLGTARRTPTAVDPDDLSALPMDAEEHREVCACLGGAIDALKPEYAEVLRALDVREEPSAQVAERLGVTANNLKVRHHRARQALRERLSDTCRVCAQHGCMDCHCGSPNHSGHH